jgi:hypothetical protein
MNWGLQRTPVTLVVASLIDFLKTGRCVIISIFHAYQKGANLEKVLCVTWNMGHDELDFTKGTMEPGQRDSI